MRFSSITTPPAVGEQIDGARGKASSPHVISARRPGRKKWSVQIRNREWAETEWTIALAVRTWPFWGVMGVSMFQSYALHFVMVHTVALLVDSGFSPAEAATLYGIMGVGMTVGFFLWGGLSDRIGREIAYTLGSLLFFITIAILGGISPAIGKTATWATAFFLGVGFGSRPTLFNLIAVDIFQGKHAGRIIGLGATGFGIGGSFGALSAGYIYDYTGSYDWAIRICMLTLVISAVSAWIAGPSRIRKTVLREQNYADRQHLLTGFYQ